MSTHKYTWTDIGFDNWVKRQVQDMREIGFRGIGTAGATRLLHDKFIIPNEIKLKDLIKSEQKVKVKWKKQLL
jgi:hypothetical protein